MSYSLPQYHSHHIRLILVLLGLTLLTVILAGLLFVFGPPYLPLWASLVVPSEQLAPNIWIFSLPVLAGLTLFAGLWFGRKTDLDHGEYLSSQALWSSIFLILTLLFALLRIIKVVL